MELRHLEHFVAVAEEGRFTRAAARCRISQSALSTSIRSLEQELGSRLFARTTRKVELTDAGRALLVEARRTLAAATSARNSVLAARGLLRGSLQVGAVETPGLFDQAAVLARFRDRHPAVGIRYVRDTSMSLIDEVAASRLDLALVSLPGQVPAQLLVTPLMTERIMFVCWRGHPLAGRQRVAISSLADEDFVGPLPGWTGYEGIDRSFARKGKRRRVSFEINDVAAILDFVAHGLGVTLAIESLAVSRPDLRAIPLAGQTMTWTLGAITQRDHATPAARAFIALLPEFRLVDKLWSSGSLSTSWPWPRKVSSPARPAAATSASRRCPRPSTRWSESWSLPCSCARPAKSS
jgi:DNA-binding transcriptional LysR family regulator